MISLLVLLVASTVAPPIGALWPDEEPSTELENIQEVWNALTGDDPNPPDWAKPVLHAVQESSSFTIIRFKRNPQQPGHGSRGIHPLLRKFDPNTFNRIKQINAVGNNRHLLYQLYVGLVYMFNPRSIPGAMRRKRNPYNNRAIHPLLQRFDRNTFNKIKQINPAGNNKRLLYQLYVGLVYMFNPAIIPGYARGASSYAASSASSYADRSASSYAARSASSYAARRVSARSAASYAGRSASSARRASSYPARTPYAAASAAKSAASSAARSASVARRHAAAAARSALSAKSASPYAARRASSARSGSSYPERTPYGAASVAESAASSAARSASAARKHAAAAARSALSVQSASSYADRSASSYAARSASSYADRSASASSPYGTVVQHGGTTKRYPGGGSGVLVNVGSNG